MSDDIGLGLSSMAVCFDFHSTNVVQISNQKPYFYWFKCHHPLITQLAKEHRQTNFFLNLFSATNNVDGQMGAGQTRGRLMALT